MFAVYTWPDDESNGAKRDLDRRVSRNLSIMDPRKLSVAGHSGMNGNAMKTNGVPRLPKHRVTDSQQVRDAEEFELEVLISDDERDDDEPETPKLYPTKA